MTRVHIDELRHSTIGKRIAAYFGLNIECMFPLQWWVELPEWAAHEVRENLFEVKLTLPPYLETAHVYSPWVPK
jgi:hypothetical protein